MAGFDLQARESCGDVVRQYPLFAGAVTVAVAAFVYAGLSFLINDTVDIFEVGFFAIFFGIGYTGVNYVWRGR